MSSKKSLQYRLTGLILLSFTKSSLLEISNKLEHLYCLSLSNINSSSFERSTQSTQWNFIGSLGCFRIHLKYILIVKRGSNGWNFGLKSPLKKYSGTSISNGNESVFIICQNKGSSEWLANNRETSSLNLLSLSKS